MSADSHQVHRPKCQSWNNVMTLIYLGSLIPCCSICLAFFISQYYELLQLPCFLLDSRGHRRPDCSMGVANDCHCWYWMLQVALVLRLWIRRWWTWLLRYYSCWSFGIFVVDECNEWCRLWCIWCLETGRWQAPGWIYALKEIHILKS